jgi:arabinogalactan endo-1,4-beta-galactosidase
MKFFKYLSFSGIALLIACNPPETTKSGFAAVSQVKSGKPVAVMLTSYSTTLLANAMVQIGNEINHGILWPEGHISHPDQLAGLLNAGVAGVKAVDPGMPVMMHIALGGQNDEAVFWLDNMIARGVQFDIIGLSYYPRWHGTLDDSKTT